MEEGKGSTARPRAATSVAKRVLNLPEKGRRDRGEGTRGMQTRRTCLKWGMRRRGGLDVDPPLPLHPQNMTCQGLPPPLTGFEPIQCLLASALRHVAVKAARTHTGGGGSRCDKV